MKLKKALSLLLAGTMALSLAACGGSGSGEEGAAKDEAAEGGKTLKVAAVETAYGAPMWEKVCDAFEAFSRRCNGRAYN